MKRKREWMTAVLLIAAPGAVCVWLFQQTSINEASYARIRLGMTISEVRDILGSAGTDVFVDASGGFSGGPPTDRSEAVRPFMLYWDYETF
jgi:hypothetical protein